MIPADMEAVSQADFFRLLYADKRDIMPSQRNPEFTTWETPNREVWGWTSPGWKNPMQPKVYAVKKSARNTP